MWCDVSETEDLFSVVQAIAKSLSESIVIGLNWDPYGEIGRLVARYEFPRLLTSIFRSVYLEPYIWLFRAGTSAIGKGFKCYILGNEKAILAFEWTFSSHLEILTLIGVKGWQEAVDFDDSTNINMQSTSFRDEVILSPISLDPTFMCLLVSLYLDFGCSPLAFFFSYYQWNLLIAYSLLLVF